MKTILFILLLNFSLASLSFGQIGFKTNADSNDAKYLFIAENYFEKDSFALALFGNKIENSGHRQFDGFLEIIEKYPTSNSANISQFYAGICFLNLQKFNKAITHLRQFNAKDSLSTALKLGLIGDSYSELGQYSDALINYLKALDNLNGSKLTPIYLLKAALIYNKIDDTKNALKLLKSIKMNHPYSNEAQNVDLFIEQISSY
ncbi:MAG: hypothetical protein HOD63_13735 [Bacteroidetes bacterium]|nr:hypothetical protein [Bacteroidota bacterium]MBT5528112.1 hypothetical protein [Cytophagia bacterium]MBT3801023.1 hypothetical protein [Bacteroidota bacterium]MBT3935476.1 hypothetical protein [Bacteroidota bacterium]MBT4339650.1 hypothetical protein [Bacteroidota bacterium]